MNHGRTDGRTDALTDARTDGRPENIQPPPAPTVGGGLKRSGKRNVESGYQVELEEDGCDSRRQSWMETIKLSVERQVRQRQDRTQPFIHSCSHSHKTDPFIHHLGRCDSPGMMRVNSCSSSGNAGCSFISSKLTNTALLEIRNAAKTSIAI